MRSNRPQSPPTPPAQRRVFYCRTVCLFGRFDPRSYRTNPVEFILLRITAQVLGRASIGVCYKSHEAFETLDMGAISNMAPVVLPLQFQ